MFNKCLILLFVLFGALQASAQDYEEIFRTEQAKSISIEPQCRFSSLSEAEEYNRTLPDPDLLRKEGLDPDDFTYGDLGIKSCFMNLSEYAALANYVATGYQIMNRVLRNRDARGIEQQKYRIEFMKSALSKVLPYQGWIKRGADIPVRALDDHQVGGIVKYEAFTSTSTGTAFIGNIQYLIYSKSCRPVPHAINYENEVICLPGTKFRVLYRNEWNGNLDLVMEEVF
ncbi:MAG: hypothetical protein V4598_06465 [Bdellovibrionota bacterium]